MRLAYLRAHPLCASCQREPASELDHVAPHRGDAGLFWDQRNWQGLCRRCHARKSSGEARIYRAAAPADVRGHLIMTMGAPGSGKSTFVGEHYAHVVSTDALRAAEYDPVRTGQVFADVFASADAALRAGGEVVIDTTANHPSIRARALR